MKKYLYTILCIALLVGACSERNHLSDGYGNFETTEILVPAEAQGKLMAFTAEEGQKISKGDTVGYIDTVQLFLQKELLFTRIAAVQAQRVQVAAKVAVLEDQMKTIMIEKERLEKLLEDKAATQQQMDQLDGQIRSLKSQIKAAEAQYVTIQSETKSIKSQIAQVNDNIRRCIIINPESGTVLEKYTEQNEMAIPGKALYKLADLEIMELRVYISGSQLPDIKLGQEVTVLIDQDEKTNQELVGKVSWISDKSEFTPKIIQTKEERVNLVYAVKITVPNDGRIKIGMPGEVLFPDNQQTPL
ncbi:MAG: HlyD family efflux transporter periplasmic adaptor subunit [Bacteroidales bacterium]|nr:HlyD family efflux transporter periplasmic adaptor subunit [Bacteroidales bacterium]